MFFGAVCAYPLPPCLAQCFHPVGLRSRSSSFFPSPLFDRRLLLLCLIEGGRVGEQEVDGDSNGLRVVFLSINRRLLLLPRLLLYFNMSTFSLSVVVYVLSVSELSEERFGCCCTSWRRLSNPWVTISALSPGAVALQRSLASSAPVSIFKISLMEAVSWVWSYLYFALMVQWATLISVPHNCCAAHSTLAKMTIAFRSSCMPIPYACVLAAFVASFSMSMATVSLQSKTIPAMLTNCCLMVVASVRSAPSVMVVTSWWS